MKANMKPRILLILATVLGSFTGVSVYAATADGTLGATSTGTVDITLTVTDMASITKLTTIALTDYTTPGAKTGDTNACIFTNSGANYTVTATAGGTFELDKAGDKIAFSAFWSDTTTTGGDNLALVHGAATVTQTTAHTSDIDCAAGTNANFNISIADSAMESAPTGAYSATVTLVITPAV